MHKLNAVLRFLAPNKYKLLVLLILSSVTFLLSEERYLEVQQKNQRFKLVNEHRYGKPFIYYIKQQGKSGKLNYAAIVWNVLIAYALTLVFFGLYILALKVWHGPSLKHRSMAFVLFVALVSLPYLLVVFFGGSLMVNSVVSRNAWQVKTLLRLGISPNRLSVDDQDFPLKEAAYNKDQKMARMLLTHGADINMANVMGETALHIAIRENAIRVARLLIQRGARINVKDKVGNTPLHYANHLRLARLLVKQNAKVNSLNKRKQTPLFTISDAATKAFLLKQGANARQVDSGGNTALHYVREGDEVAPLARAGINMNHRNHKGQTALHLMVPTGQGITYLWAPRVIRALIKHGAQVDVPDKTGMSPLHYTIRNCNPRSKSGASIEIGKILYRASDEVRLQLKSGKIFGQLAVVISEDRQGCWKLISGRPVPREVLKFRSPPGK